MNLEYEEQEDYYGKCGELFLTVKGSIAFHCTLCKNRYKGFQEYHDHVMEEHFAPFLEEISDSMNEKENSFDPLSGEDYDFNTESLDEYDERVPLPCEDLSQNSLTESNELPNPVAIVPGLLTKKEAIKLKLGPGNFNPKITDRKFKCPLCDFTCGDKSNIKGHIRRHSMNKPHQCTECMKSFHTRTELNIHLRTHTGERPYLCTLCGMSFITSSHLGSHQKRHNNVRNKECPICERRFHDLRSLRRHMVVHSDKRNYKCEQCDASFKLSKGLKAHIKLHENKREYQCELCDSRFNQRAGLYSHMKSCHTVIKGSVKNNLYE